jgi:hypothetical protein
VPVVTIWVWFFEGANDGLVVLLFKEGMVGVERVCGYVA